MTVGLLLIDIQNDYFKGGKMVLSGTEEAAAKARQVLDYFRSQKLFTAHIQHQSLGKDASFFIPNTDGAKFHDTIKPQADERVIQKNYPNSFRETELLMELKKSNVNHLIITGMMTHMCVDSTVRAAVDHGFTVTVLEDTVATRDLTYNGESIPADRVNASFLSALSGTFAKLATADEWLQKN